MNTTGVTEGPYVTFKEETADQLKGKEGYLVELGTADGTVKILGARINNAIGTYEGRLAPGSKHVRVRLLGGPGTARYVATGTIAKGAKFKAAAGGKVIAASSGLLIGRSINQGNTAANERFLAIPIMESHD